MGKIKSQLEEVFRAEMPEDRLSEAEVLELQIQTIHSDLAHEIECLEEILYMCEYYKRPIELDVLKYHLRQFKKIRDELT